MEQEFCRRCRGPEGRGLQCVIQRGPQRWPEEGLGELPRAGAGGQGLRVAWLQGCSSATGAQLCVHMSCGGGTWFMQETAIFSIQL